jgi:hypothetical protein
MTWLIKRSPFRRDEDPVEHRVNLLAHEAIKAGSPLSDIDRKILREENADNWLAVRSCHRDTRRQYRRHPGAVRVEVKSTCGDSKELI